MRLRMWIGACRAGLAAVVSLLLAFPAPLGAQAQRAGEVQRVRPDASIERGAQTLPAAVRSPVHWQDVVLTAPQGRARLRLDDGSMLNVGSASSLRVEAHDPAAQRTTLELSYGRVRNQVVRLANPNAQHEVRTPVATAGVIGTDFFLSYDAGEALLMVFEGLVRFCDLAGNCVEVGPGMYSVVRGGPQAAAPPTPPARVSPAMSREAVESTQVETAAQPGGLSGTQLTVLTIATAAGIMVLGWAIGRNSTSGSALFQGEPPITNR